MDLIYYPKTRDTCIYVGIQASLLSDHAVWIHWDENALRCFQFKKTQSSQWSSPEKDVGIQVLQDISLQCCEIVQKWLRNSSHHYHQESPSNKGMTGFHVVLAYKMEGLFHQGIGIKWTLHCKIPVCFEIKRSRHTEKTQLKGQRAASAHIRSVFHQRISNITTKN